MTRSEPRNTRASCLPAAVPAAAQDKLAAEEPPAEEPTREPAKENARKMHAKMQWRKSMHSGVFLQVGNSFLIRQVLLCSHAT